MSTKDKPLQPLQPHAYAQLFPEYSGEDFQKLVTDIKEKGLRVPVTTIEGENGELLVLDGVNRQRAAFEAGIEPTYAPYQGDDPLGFVISANMVRRHLTESQRAMIAAELETITHGGNRQIGQDAPVRVDRKTAAASLNVSERTVSNAAAVKKCGTPELQQSVRDGTISVKPAAELARKPAEEQHKAVKEAKDRKAAKAAARAAPKRKGKAVPKVKTTNGKAKEVAAPSAKHFKDTVNAFASATEHLFNPKLVAMIEHEKLSSEQRNRVVKCLLKVIQKAKALHEKLEGK